MISALLYARGGEKVFVPGTGPNGGERFLPFIELRSLFAERGVELVTAETADGRSLAFTLHIDAQRRVPRGIPAYAYLYEDPLVRPRNASARWLAPYRLLWTSNEDLIDGMRIRKLGYPVDLEVRETPDYAERDLYCTLIAGNKALLYPDSRNLHAKRLEVIRYFERHYPDEFHLFGMRWNLPALQPGRLGRFLREYHRLRAVFVKDRPFPSYRGPARSKREVLERSRFYICYETARGSPGYLTEKIFDCFTAGCVPVYIGASHSCHPLPPETYIDGDRFASPADLVDCLHGITAAEHQRFQSAARAFLRSGPAQLHSRNHFCETIVNDILVDLGDDTGLPSR